MGYGHHPAWQCCWAIAAFLAWTTVPASARPQLSLQQQQHARTSIRRTLHIKTLPQNHSQEARAFHAARLMVRGTRLDEQSPLSPDAYHQLAKLRQEMYCRDAFPADFNPDETRHQDLAGHRTITLRRSDKPLFITIYHGTSDIVSNAVQHGGLWEPDDLALMDWALSAALPPGAPATSRIAPAVFVDVGANIGMFSLFIAEKGYEVISFEAFNTNQRMMRTSLCASHPSIRKLMTLHPFGLGAQRDTCYLVSDGNLGDGHLICGVANATEAGAKMSPSALGAYVVRDKLTTERLDAVLQRDIQLLKIDVEGFESHVIRGAQKLLKEHHVWFIMMEFNKGALRQKLNGTGARMHQHVVDLHRMGYRVSDQHFTGPYLSEDQIITASNTEGQWELSNLYLAHKDYQVPS